MKKLTGSRFVVIFSFFAIVLILFWRMHVLEATQPTPDAGSTRIQISANARSTGRDLKQDERQGGHTLARHVGRSAEELARRLQREAGIAAASSFSDRATAEAIVGTTLDRETERVAFWMRHNKDNLTLDYRGEDRTSIGIVLRRGEVLALPARDARIVLRKRGDQFFVLTAYPEVP